MLILNELFLIHFLNETKKQGFVTVYVWSDE